MVLNDINELAEIEALSKKVKQLFRLLSCSFNNAKNMDYKACAREELIYNIEDILQKSNDNVSQEDLPDDFYDLTVNDLRFMLDDLQRKKYEKKCS